MASALPAYHRPATDSNKVVASCAGWPNIPREVADNYRRCGSKVRVFAVISKPLIAAGYLLLKLLVVIADYHFFINTFR